MKTNSKLLVNVAKIALISILIGTGYGGEISKMPDDDFSTLLRLMNQFLENSRSELTSLTEKITCLDSTVSDFRTRIQRLEREGTLPNPTIENLQNEINQIKNDTAETIKYISNEMSVVLPERIQRNVLAIQELRSTAVTNLRFGTSKLAQAWNGPGFRDTYGYVVTGAYNHDQDYYIDGINRRKVELQINGRWLGIVAP